MNKTFPKYKLLSSGSSNMGQDSAAKSPWTGCSQFLPTTQKIIQFSDGKSPKPGDKIVSIFSIFLDHFVIDLFHEKK